MTGYLVPSYDDFDFDAFYEQEDREFAEWQAWWDGLSDADRAKEEEMMAAYVEECRIEREARGFDV